MTTKENEAVNKIIAICVITEDEARDTIFYIKRACIQKEARKNYNSKKAGEAMSRLIAITKEEKK